MDYFTFSSEEDYLNDFDGLVDFLDQSVEKVSDESVNAVMAFAHAYKVIQVGKSNKAEIMIN